jgi:hypothetical protein
MLARITPPLTLSARETAYVNFTTAYIERTLARARRTSSIAQRIVLKAKVPMHLLHLGETHG